MPTRPPKQRKREQRPNATDRGYDHRWRQRRESFLADHPLCVECERQGRVREATVVDHVIPHRGDPDLFWNGELQALCKDCHDVKTASGQ